MASQLVAVAFDGVGTADGMLEMLNDLQDRDLLTITDAVVAAYPPAMSPDRTARIATGGIALSEQGVVIKQTRGQKGKFAVRGGGAGLLVGLLLGGPIGGLAAGAALGAITGGLKDFGVDDSFVRSVSRDLRPDTSALFLLVEASDPQEVLAALRPFKGRVIQTTLSSEQEARLQAALG